MAYRFEDKECLLAFGKDPEISLASARKARNAARDKLNVGIDPAEAKPTEKAAASANTFEKLARAWHANRLGEWRESVAKDTISRLERDVFPEIGALPIASITHL